MSFLYLFRYDSPFGGSSERSRKNDDFGSNWGSSNTNSSGGWGMDRFDSKQDTFSESISSRTDDR